MLSKLISNRSPFMRSLGSSEGGQTLIGFHHLTVGPWRGVFLVAVSADQVIALVFSKAPHHLEERLDEVTARYRVEASARDADD